MKKKKKELTPLKKKKGTLGTEATKLCILTYVLPLTFGEAVLLYFTFVLSG